MSSTIKVKRGINANFASVTLQAGEPAFVTDTGKFYVGNGTTKVLINPDSSNAVTSVAGKTGVVTLNSSDVGLGNVTNESKTTMFTNSALTGTPTAPTATAGTNTTQISTTAFVKSAVDTAVAGNVATATKLQTSRTISLSGDVAGSIGFDGSANVNISTSIATLDGGTF